MSIPKIIHWCWVGPDPVPPFLKDCIKTWKKHMPDYEIKLWDRNSFDFNSVPYVKEAFDARKWAFVADYIRLYALYHYGGIYLDSDVKVFKSFDPFLKDSFFTGHDIDIEGNVTGPEAAIMGAEQGHAIIKECLDLYNNIPVIEGEKTELKLIPGLISPILEKIGYKKEDTCQELGTGNRIYSSKYFVNGNTVKNQKPNFAFHVNAKSWVFTERGKFFQYCWRHNLLSFYQTIEKLRKKLF